MVRKHLSSEISVNNEKSERNSQILDMSQEKICSQTSEEKPEINLVLKLFISEKEMYYFETECNYFIPRVAKGHMNIVRPKMVNLFHYTQNCEKPK